MYSTRIALLLSFFTVLVFFSCSEPSRSYTLKGTTLLLDSSNVITKDTLQEQIIHKYRESLEADMNRVLVHSAQVMERGTPEGLLNNFVADLVLDIGEDLYQPEDNKKIDFCLLNYGGLRVPLPKGEITYGRVFELLPFENEMVVITLSGEKTLELFQYLAQAQRGMPVSAVQLIIKDEEPAEIFIRGENFDINRTYKVLTSDYLAGGGDSMDFFLQPLNYELLGMRIRDAIIKHMKEVSNKGEEIKAQLDGRIKVSG